MKKYKIVGNKFSDQIRKRLKGIEAEVNEHLSAGWSLHGPLVVVIPYHSVSPDLAFYQAMVREDEVTKTGG